MKYSGPAGIAPARAPVVRPGRRPGPRILGAVEPLNVREYEQRAAGMLEAAVHGFFAGGADDELTLADNVEAYRRWQLRPRVLVDVAEASTAASVLGEEIAVPLLVAPVAYQRLAHPDGEVGMARAAAAVGTIMCLSSFATSGWQE